MSKVKKVLLYVSVRLFDNEERKAKVEEDLNRLREYCNTKGYDIGGEFIESRQNSKPEWLKLVKFVSQRIGEFSNVFIVDFSVVGRSFDEFWEGVGKLETNYCKLTPLYIADLELD